MHFTRLLRAMSLSMAQDCSGSDSQPGATSFPVSSGDAASAPSSSVAVVAVPSTSSSAAVHQDPVAKWTGNAEYVVRWDPASGGPQAALEVARALGFESGKHEEFEIDYYGLATPSPPPTGAAPLLRLRTKLKDAKPSKYELTYKLRSPALFDGATCPLGTTIPMGAEMDVTFLGVGIPMKRVYSASCELEDKASAPAPPAALGATPGSCPARMARDELGTSGTKTKVELWTFADGSRLLEVSWKADHSAANEKTFEATVAKPIVSLGAVPIAASKTEAASTCGRGAAK